MGENETQRDSLRRRIGENQRRATELSIELRLESEEKNNVDALSETAELLQSVVDELEHARRVLIAAG